MWHIVSDTSKNVRILRKVQLRKSTLRKSRHGTLILNTHYKNWTCLSIDFSYLAATCHPKFRFGWADSEIEGWPGWNHHSGRTRSIVLGVLKAKWIQYYRSILFIRGHKVHGPPLEDWGWLKNPVWSCDMFINIEEGIGKLDKVWESDESSKPITFKGSCLYGNCSG